MDFSWFDVVSLSMRLLDLPCDSMLPVVGRAVGWMVAFELVISVAIDRFDLESRAPEFWQRIKLYVAVLITACLLML